MKKVLFISYYFPPIHSVESTMAINAVKYLPESLWSVDVVSTKSSKERPNNPEHLDSSLPDHIIVHRTNSFENIITRILNRLGFIPDSVFGWGVYAVNTSQKLIINKGVDFIVSRSNPVTSHLVALFLKYKHPELPWVAMFSDPWADNPYVRHLPTWVQSWRRRMEHSILQLADKIIVTTNSTKDFFVARHGLAEKFVVLPNSYDPEELDSFIFSCPPSNNLVMSHVGNFYGLRSPEPLLKALDLLRNEPWFKNIRVRLVGSLGEFKDLISQYNLVDIIQITGTVSRKKALQTMNSSNLLILVDAQVGAYSMFLPAKLVEYIAFNKPILGLTTPGESADLITKHNAGVVINPTDINAIAEAIRNFYYSFVADDLNDTKIEVADNYSAKTYGQNLSKIIANL